MRMSGPSTVGSPGSPAAAIRMIPSWKTRAEIQRGMSRPRISVA